MDCKNARLLLEVAHPLATELDARDTAELANHLSDCPDCGPWAETEHRLDELFGNAMRSVPIPDGLSQRIIGRLHVDRDAWYRGWAVRVAGVAAALLLAVWASWAFWLGKKPGLDIDKIVFENEQFLYKADQVEQEFAARGVKMLAPPNFDYALLQSHGMADFQGKRVPQLLFFQPGNKDVPSGVATVYVVSSQQFNLEQLNNMHIAGSRQNIMVRPHESSANFAYVIFYPVGASLERSFFQGSHGSKALISVHICDANAAGSDTQWTLPWTLPPHFCYTPRLKLSPDTIEEARIAMKKLLLAATAVLGGLLGTSHAQQGAGTPNEPFGVPVGPQKAPGGQLALPTTPGYQKLPTLPQPGAEFLGNQPNFTGNSFVQPGAQSEKNAPIWAYLRQNFDAPDPNQDIAIQLTAGNCVICLQSYSGDNAARMARDLVMELRTNPAYKLNAFTFRQGVAECKAEQQRIRDEVKRKQDDFAKNNLPPDTPLRVAFTRYEIQYAVLIAGYKDMQAAKVAMDELRNKKLPPLDPSKVQLDMKYGVEYDKSGKPTKTAAVAINPLAQAWVCPNPCQRAERSTGPSVEDMALMKKLNAQEPYSLLKCPKKITLAVREFAMPSELRTDKKTTMSFLEKIGLSSSADTYDTAAISAQNLADLLRKGNFEAYVLHTKYSSYVTVGSYDSEQDPRIERDRKNLAEINGQLNPAARLAAQPRLMAVPR